MSWLSEDQLRAIGMRGYGKNVLISDSVRIYNPGNLSLGNNVRIDDFCVISAGQGGITVGDYVHIAVYCSLQGAGRISLGDFSGLSSRVAIYSSNEDYSGNFLTNPAVPSQYRNAKDMDVSLGKHAIIGSGAVILPGVQVGEGVAVGALSLVTKNCTPYSIYFGHPAKRIKARGQGLLDLERKLREAEL